MAAVLSGAYVAYQRGRRVQRRVLVDLAAAVDQRTERLDELDEVRGELERMESDSAGALAGAVLRRRIGERSALRQRSGTEQ